MGDSHCHRATIHSWTACPFVRADAVNDQSAAVESGHRPLGGLDSDTEPAHTARRGDWLAVVGSRGGWTVWTHGNADGDVAFALALVTILQVARIVTIPFWLGVFLPFGPSEVIQIIVSLALYILLPLAVGMVLRRFLRDRSVRWSLIAQRAGSTLIVVVIVSAVLLYRSTLAALAISWTMLMILGIQFLGWGLGYVLGGPETAGRRTVAVTAIVRSSAAALLIANPMYSEQPLVAATVIAYSVVALGVAALAAVSMGRLHRVDSIQLPVKANE